MADTSSPSTSSTTTAKLTDKVEAAVTTAVAKPNVEANLTAIPAIMNELIPVIEAIVNSTNAEPWYQSRVTWGAIIVLLGLILGVFGITLDAGKQALLVSLAVPLSGVAVVIYGRWFAKKPLGS